MSIDTFLARLDRPRRTGARTYRARCPAHGGGNRQTLAVRETDDGTILLRCFSNGCSAAEIAAAVGLELHDLFPDRLPEGRHHRSPDRRPWSPADILVGIAHELTVAAIIVCDIARRGSATDAERRQLLEIVGRVNDEMEAGRASI